MTASNGALVKAHTRYINTVRRITRVCTHTHACVQVCVHVQHRRVTTRAHIRAGDGYVGSRPASRSVTDFTGRRANEKLVGCETTSPPAPFAAPGHSRWTYAGCFYPTFQPPAARHTRGIRPEKYRPVVGLQLSLSEISSSGLTRISLNRHFCSTLTLKIPLNLGWRTSRYNALQTVVLS